VDDGITAPASVVERSSETTTGTLTLTDTGLWALVWESGQRRSDIEAGDVVRVDADENRFRAHYAVAANKNWGLLMQRLGGGPVPMEFGDVSLSVVTPDQIDQACVGDAAAWPDSECLTEAGAPASWDVYALDGERLEGPADPAAWAGRMPYRRLALATRTKLAPDVLETTSWTPRGRWLAIRRKKRRAPNYDAVLVADEACEAHESNLRASGVELSFADIGATRDPVEVELAAANHRADGLVRCSGDGGLVFLAPVAFRPLMEIPYAGFHGVSLLGWRALKVPANDPRAVELAARVTTAVGSGRFDRADFHVDALIPRLKDDEARRLARLSAPVAAAAQLPEHALRRLDLGAEGMWNPDRDIAYRTGQAWAWAAFDNHRQALIQMKAVNDLVAKSRTSRTAQIWRAWNELRAFAAEYSRRSTAEDGFRQARSFFDDVPRAQSWREAVEWLRWSELGGPLPDIEGADARFDLFRQAVRGGDGACDGCRLDPYGLDASAWLASVGDDQAPEALDAMARLPLTAVRPGLTRLTVDSTRAKQLPLTLRVGLVSMAPTRAVGQSLTDAVEAIARASSCNGTESAMTNTDPLSRTLLLRAAERNDARLATASWLVTTGLDLACQDPTRLVEQIVERVGNDDADASLLAGFATSALSADTSGELEAADAKLMARAAKAGSMPQTCMLWNQAAALAALESGRVKLAETFILSSVDCHDDAVAEDLDDSELFLSAMLHYERTRRVPGSLPEDVARRLSIAARHRVEREQSCIGRAGLEYWRSAGVSRRVAELAERIDVPPGESDDSLVLRTASLTASRAEASLTAARRALAEGRPDVAARTLRDAEQDFRAIAHAPGLARTRFLIEQIYGEQFDAFAKPADEKETEATDDAPTTDGAMDASERLRRGEARGILDGQAEVSPPPRARLAAAIVLGRDDAVDTLLSRHEELAKSTYCGGPESD
jgi:hypothetical protein